MNSKRLKSVRNLLIERQALPVSVGSSTLTAVARSFLNDASGQATVEYVLLMVVLVGVIITVGKTFHDRMLALVQGPLTAKLQAQFFSAPHKFPINLK